MPSAGLNLDVGDYFTDGFVFNDELYIGGNFNVGQYQSILKWDGQTISPIEDGLRGSISWVTNMASYKGKLYVAGGFWDSSGNPGNNIVVIDNGKMKPVGLGFTALPDAHGISQVNGMQVHNNRLYVSGSFHYANGLPASRIAYFDGTSWCAPTTESVNQPLGEMAVYKGDIILDTKGWYYRDNDTIRGIAKIEVAPPAACGTPVSVSEVAASKNIQLFPQPASDQFFLEGLTTGNLVEVYDLTGRQVRSWISGAPLEGFSLAGLGAGVYLVRVSAENYTVKLVKEAP
ncbi:MAG: T9SS type A sorting domain-containing protein [Salibacteraceae bacterium]